ncbi:Botcinic acid biosynthesis cluster B protein 12 [Cladobotryum mycophilum]|uniref:Botcinic acid biosynthesis cluster B protein 12 n=1 Tax=Cladobotryum mycophilum TaxID=491253 RepID=A0ABR0SCN2_9HYPO
MRNLQYSTLPIDLHKPTGPRTDLSSFQLTTINTVFTSYGVDTPTLTPAVYNYSATGILQGATDFLEVLAWGYDCHGVGYRVSYSSFTALTNTLASIDILSRTNKSPDASTLKSVQNALVAYGDANITALAQAIGPALQDDARDGMPPIRQCDAYCMSNQDLLGLL